MRLLVMSDLHLGARLLEWGDHAETRRGELSGAWDEAVGLALDNEVDGILVAGDLFDVSDPGESEREAVRTGLERLVTAGKTVVLLPGIHDGLFSLRSIYRSARFPRGVTVVDWSESRTVTLTVGGEPLHLTTRALVPGREDGPLAPPAGGPEGPGVRIGLFHGLLQAAKEPRAWYAPVIPAADVEASGLDLLVLGGEHAFRQETHGKTTLVAPGSPVGLGLTDTEPRVWAVVELGPEGVRVDPRPRSVPGIVREILEDGSVLVSPEVLAEHLRIRHEAAGMVVVHLRGDVEPPENVNAVFEALSGKLPFAVRFSGCAGAGHLDDKRHPVRRLFVDAIRAREESNGGFDQPSLTAAIRYGLAKLDTGGDRHVD